LRETSINILPSKMERPGGQIGYWLLEQSAIHHPTEPGAVLVVGEG